MTTPLFENDAELEATLKELRPAPDIAFAAELDLWATAGFPPRHAAARAAGNLRARLEASAKRLRSTPRRRLIAPAGAFAVVAVVVVTAAVALSGGASSDSNPATDFGGSNILGFLNKTSEPVPPSAQSDTPQSSSSAAEAGSSTQPSSDSLEAESADEVLPQVGQTGPYAAGRDQRDIERSASIVLATDPDGLRDAAAGVFGAVHSADGIVLNSSIDGGPKGGTANFELMIPTAKLSDTLAAISSVAEVRSRHEASDDITGPTVRVSERLQDANATVRGLLDQLAAADTDAERAAAEAELRAARNRAAGLRSELSSLDRRANLSRVSVRIEASGSSDDGSGGPWGVGDGLDGAGRVLALAAGVIVIGLAALAPFALLALLAWLARRAWIRHSRRAALTRP